MLPSGPIRRKIRAVHQQHVGLCALQADLDDLAAIKRAQIVMREIHGVFSDSGQRLFTNPLDERAPERSSRVLSFASPRMPGAKLDPYVSRNVSTRVFPFF